jgi:hypothetical protein
MNPANNFESKFAEERLRQARHSFNLAIGCITACVATTFIGVGLVYNGKVAVGIVTGAAGAVPITRCVKLYREANDRLDELMDEPTEDDTEEDPN